MLNVASFASKAQARLSYLLALKLVKLGLPGDMPEQAALEEKLPSLQGDGSLLGDCYQLQMHCHRHRLHRPSIQRAFLHDRGPFGPCPCG